MKPLILVALSLSLCAAGYVYSRSIEISYPMTKGKYLLFLTPNGNEAMIRKVDFSYCLADKSDGYTKIYHWGQAGQENGNPATSINCQHEPSEILLVLDPRGKEVRLEPRKVSQDIPKAELKAAAATPPKEEKPKAPATAQEAADALYNALAAKKDNGQLYSAVIAMMVLKGMLSEVILPPDLPLMVKEMGKYKDLKDNLIELTKFVQGEKK